VIIGGPGAARKGQGCGKRQYSNDESAIRAPDAHSWIFAKPPLSMQSGGLRYLSGVTPLREKGKCRLVRWLLAAWRACTPWDPGALTARRGCELALALAS
jgi:hypothetical protein